MIPGVMRVGGGFGLLGNITVKAPKNGQIRVCCLYGLVIYPLL